MIIPAADAGRLTFTPIDDAWIGQADPTTNHGNASRIEVGQSSVKEGLLRLRMWVWKASTQSWLIDSDELPDGLRTVIVIERGQVLFIVSSRATTLEVTVGG